MCVLCEIKNEYRSIIGSDMSAPVSRSALRTSAVPVPRRARKLVTESDRLRNRAVLSMIGSINAPNGSSAPLMESTAFGEASVSRHIRMATAPPAEWPMMKLGAISSLRQSSFTALAMAGNKCSRSSRGEPKAWPGRSTNRQVKLLLNAIARSARSALKRLCHGEAALRVLRRLFAHAIARSLSLQIGSRTARANLLACQRASTWPLSA